MIKRGNEDAFEFMVDKYKFFIAKNIKKFNLIKDFDDVFQESLMILYKSIYSFDESYDKSFMRYFELNLTHKLITLKKKVNRYGQFLSEKLPVLCDFTILEDRRIYFTENEILEALTKLSDFEKTVFNTKIINKKTVRETAKKLNCSEKKIYNALDRIKNKLKMHLM
ncbi:MAG: sigma-70 family RNA polymerase sigma factor [Tenericutes bacterium]|nr:sigma-70 family RNA polymerase sigma factor [Mycoplasmatota bacterium]